MDLPVLTLLPVASLESVSTIKTPLSQDGYEVTGLRRVSALCFCNARGNVFLSVTSGLKNARIRHWFHASAGFIAKRSGAAEFLKKRISDALGGKIVLSKSVTYDDLRAIKRMFRLGLPQRMVRSASS